ncbi:MAG: S49 family peptidase [Bdellovibrionales bacterium]|nr:S49 family peptidase [Bdellovibrionales bacterium]
MRHIYQSVLSIISFVFLGAFIVAFVYFFSIWNPLAPEVKEPSLLSMRLEGVILDTGDFIRTLRTYREDPNIKGMIIHINSPGGSVGSSQELYTEIKRVREEFRKPVVVSGGSLVAGGAYYAASGADRIVANPGTLMGSISAFMEFSQPNQSQDGKTHEQIVVKTGELEDPIAGAYQMKLRDKELFQGILVEVHDQFKQAIQKSRSLSPDLINKYADGRIFTGATAVRLGFADQVGSFEDALRVAGNLAGLGANPKLFRPRSLPSASSGFWQDRFRVNSSAENITESTQLKDLRAQLLGRPLYLMPGSL